MYIKVYIFKVDFFFIEMIFKDIVDNQMSFLKVLIFNR